MSDVDSWLYFILANPSIPDAEMEERYQDWVNEGKL